MSPHHTSRLTTTELSTLLNSTGRSQPGLVGDRCAQFNSVGPVGPTTLLIDRNITKNTSKLIQFQSSARCVARGVTGVVSLLSDPVVRSRTVWFSGIFQTVTSRTEHFKPTVQISTRCNPKRSDSIRPRRRRPQTVHSNPNNSQPNRFDPIRPDPTRPDLLTTELSD